MLALVGEGISQTLDQLIHSVTPAEQWHTGDTAPSEELGAFSADTVAEKECNLFFWGKKTCTAATAAKAPQILPPSYPTEPMGFLCRIGAKEDCEEAKFFKPCSFLAILIDEKKNNQLQQRPALLSCRTRPNTTHIKGAALHSY